MPELTDASRLLYLERLIQDNLPGFMEVLINFRLIKEARLYEGHYATMRDYVTSSCGDDIVDILTIMAPDILQEVPANV